MLSFGNQNYERDEVVRFGTKLTLILKTEREGRHGRYSQCWKAMTFVYGRYGCLVVREGMGG